MRVKCAEIGRAEADLLILSYQREKLILLQRGLVHIYENSAPLGLFILLALLAPPPGTYMSNNHGLHTR